jgi:YggT family protein
MFSIIYNYTYLLAVTALGIFVFALLMRLIFSYADPNPFGKIGRAAFWLKRKTDRFVLPAADFISIWRIDRKLAPVLTILISCFIVWVGLSFVYKILFMVNGIVGSAQAGSVQSLIGYLFGGLVAIYIFLILLRIVSIYTMGYTSKLRQILAQISDPVLAPARKIIPPVGMLDISALVVLIVLSVIETLIERMLINVWVPF